MSKFEVIMGLIAKFDVTPDGRNVYLSRYASGDEKSIEYEFSFKDENTDSSFPKENFSVAKNGKEYHFRLNGIKDDDFDEDGLSVIFEELAKAYDTYLELKLARAWMNLGVYEIKTLND